MKSEDALAKRRASKKAYRERNRERIRAAGKSYRERKRALAAPIRQALLLEKQQRDDAKAAQQRARELDRPRKREAYAKRQYIRRLAYKRRRRQALLDRSHLVQHFVQSWPSIERSQVTDAHLEMLKEKILIQRALRELQNEISNHH